MKEAMHSTGRHAPGRAAARGTWALAVVVGLGACAEGEFRRIPREHPTFTSTSRAARVERESQMNREWQNRPLTELMDSKGKPRMVMAIPGGGNPPSFAVVYDRDPASGCIDAFAVSSRGEPVIRIYHCR